MLLSDAIKRGASRKQASSQVKAPAPVPPVAPVKSVPTVAEVTGFLRSMNTRTGGEMYDASCVEHPYQSYWVASPSNKTRRDDLGSYDDEKSWDTWYSFYRSPLTREVLAKLDDRFGAGLFDVSVEEKGNVYVTMRR